LGRVRTVQVKSLTQQLVEYYADRFNEDFDNNKKVVDEVTDIQSKKMRNKVAGYITHLVNQERKQIKTEE
jgi:small subunit ribosomal protein S17e